MTQNDAQRLNFGDLVEFVKNPKTEKHQNTEGGLVFWEGGSTKISIGIFVGSWLDENFYEWYYFMLPTVSSAVVRTFQADRFEFIT